MPVTRIYLIRHGHVHNPTDILYGRLPRFRLSGRGRREARSAGRFLQKTPLAEVFSSPLLRARQTAARIARYGGCSRVRISGLLNEVHNPFEGRPAASVDALDGDVYSGAGAEYEQPRDIVLRVLRFVNRVRRRYDGDTVAAVTHGDVIVFMTLWATQMALSPHNKLRLPHGYPATGSVTAFSYRTSLPDERPRVDYHAPA